MTVSRPVFVVDDEQPVLDSLRCLLQCDKHEVHCFSTAKAFLSTITPDQVGCLITDLGMPEIDGFELQERLMDMHSMLSIIIVTGRADVSATVRLMKNGAVTLLEKPYPPEVLLKEVQHSLDLSQWRAERHRQRRMARSQLKLLDDDERAVLALAADGLPNKAISHRLALSARTVDRRRQSALTKLGISSPAGFTRLLSQASDEALGQDTPWIDDLPKPPRSNKVDDDDQLPPVGMALV
ncbi:MAG: response regulator transcription factor [Pirellulaceae bacterium]|nr:response regulator transcription factor [Pirellulaceae bacterium]